jgi:mono/diheme cytochrome c family protein
LIPFNKLEVKVMKKLIPILGVVLFIISASTAVGKVVVKTAPLEWQDFANIDGDEMFDNLCANCHGTGGKGDGPAVGALEKGVPDLTVLAAKNGGVYGHKKVEGVIFGKHRSVATDAIDMPMWGEQFMYVRPGPGISTFPRRYYARERVRTLSTYIESLQVVQVD